MKRTLQTFIYFLTVVLGHGVGFLLLPIVTRYLSPAAYGEYNLALTLSGLAGTLGSTWIRNVGFRLYFEAKRAGRTRAFFWTTALFQAVTLLLVYGAMLLAAPLFWGELVSLRVMAAAGLTLLLGDFFTYTVGFLRAEEESGHFAAAEIASGLIRFAATLGGLLLGFRSPELLFLAAALAVAAPGLYGVLVLHARLSGPMRLAWPVMRDLLRFGPPSLPFSVSSWFERMVDRLVLAHFHGTALVGVYSAGYALADRILGAVVMAIFMMSWPDILRAWTEGGVTRASQAVTHAMRLYFWLTVGPTVFIVLFSELLTGLLGPAYERAAPIIPVVVTAAWLSGFTTYLNRHFELNKRFAAFSGITAIGAGTNLALNLVLVPRLALMGAALATFGNYLVNWIIFFLVRDRKLTRIPYQDLAAALALAGLAWLLSALSGLPPLGRALVFVLSYSVGLGLRLLADRPQRRRFRAPAKVEGD